MRYLVGRLVLAACLMAGPVSSVQAQVDSREGIALQNQIYQLRQELKSVEDQFARGGGSSRPLVAAPPPPQQVAGGNELLAQLLTRVDALEEQLRQLRGQLDETQNRLQLQNQDLGKRIDDLAFQASPPRPPPTGPVPFTDRGEPAPPPPNPPPAARPPGPRTAEATLREGNAALARRDFAAAEAAAREVLANRTSPRAYDAQFLLAQALAGQRQYPQAAVAYDDVYNRARTGSHAQEARLGLASTLTAINEKKAACDVLVRMRTEFPQLHPEVSAGMVTTGQRAGCK